MEEYVTTTTENSSYPQNQYPVADGNKWFELFYLGLEQGYTIDMAAKRADKAYLVYENRVNSR